MACLGLVANSARADDRQEAERHFRLGVALQKVEDFDAAAREFQVSLQLFPTKSALFNLANCLQGLHRYEKALAAFERLQREYGKELEEPMLAATKAQMDELANLIGWLRLEIDPPSASVRIDGEPVEATALRAPVRLSLGQHEVSASLDGYKSETLQIHLAPKETLTRRIALVPVKDTGPKAPPAELGRDAGAEPGVQPLPPPREEEKGSSTLALLTSGLGAALLVGGTVTGLFALSLDADLKDVCNDGHCPVERAADVDRLGTLTTASNVLIGVGAAAAAGGLMLFMLNASDAGGQGGEVSAASLNLSLGADYAGAEVKTRF